MTILSPCRFFFAKSVTRIRLASMTAPSALERVFDGAGRRLAETASPGYGQQRARRRAIEIRHVRRAGGERGHMPADRAGVAALHRSRQRGVGADLAGVARARHA